MYDTINETA